MPSLVAPVVLLVFFIALPTAVLADAPEDEPQGEAAKSKGEVRGDSSPRESHGRGHDATPASEGKRDWPKGGARIETRPPGRLEATEAGVQGRYVGFVKETETCDLRDHRAAGAVFFEIVELPGPCEDERLKGHRYELRGQGAQLTAYDTPAGVLRFRAEPDAYVRLDLAPGVVAEPAPFGFRFAAGEALARLVVEPETVVFDGSSLEVRGDGNFLADAPLSNVLARPELRAAVESRTLGANVALLFEEGRPAIETTALDDVEVRAATTLEGTLRVLVDSDLTSGRAVALHLPLQAFAMEGLRVDYYDVDETNIQTPVAIHRADSLADASTIDIDEGPEYAVEADGEWVRVVVGVPHFSVHLIEVSSIAPLAQPTVLGGFVLGLFASFEAGVLMFMGRRKKV